MKRTSVFLALLIGLALGTWLAYERGWGSSKVTAFVENASPEAIETVTLQIESCSGKRSIEIGPFDPGQRRRLQYQVCGEGGYTITARFHDGHTVEGKGSYVETGYVTTDNVYSDRVTSSQKFF